MSRPKSALYLPLFDDLAEPREAARVAAEAEAEGWDGCFVWDQLSWREPARRIADAWITLAAMAAATERIRLGPMVTPLPRRRPAKVARETATLDRLSCGRLTLGVGIGSDDFGSELSRTAKQLDDRLRGQMLDEAVSVLRAAWSGAAVHHHGEHYTVDDMRFLPAPVQPAGVPIWAAGFPGSRKPLRRGAMLDGFFPANVENPDQLAAIAAAIAELRGPAAGPHDHAVALPAEKDPDPYLRAGASWWLVDFDPGVRVETVRAVLRNGPGPR